MLKKKLLLLLSCATFLTSCKEGPDLSVCLSDPANNQAVCSGYKNREPKQPFVLPYPETENYIMLSPDDAELLINYCKLKKKERAYALQFLQSIKR